MKFEVYGPFNLTKKQNGLIDCCKTTKKSFYGALIVYDEKRRAYEQIAPSVPGIAAYYWHQIMPVSDDFVDNLICKNILKKIKKGDFADSKKVGKE